MSGRPAPALSRLQAPASLQRTLRPFARRALWAALYFNAVLAVGTVGYHVIEGWGLLDSLYMAAITATGVGFQEVHPLTTAGRIFTMGLLVGGITGLGIWWALITALIVETDLGGLLRRHRSMRKVEGLSGHTIVCGAGRMGRVIITELERAGRDFVAIDNSPAGMSALLDERPDLTVIEGDASREATLRAAGIERAAGLAACLTDDADNLLLCLTARGLAPGLEIVARASDEEAIDKLRRAGANHVISPNLTGAVRMAATLLRPSVVSFLDAATLGPDISLRMEQATLPPNSSLAGKTLAAARIPLRTGLIVLALRKGHGDGPPVYNPGPETLLEPGDVMIVLGRKEQVEKLRRYVS